MKIVYVAGERRDAQLAANALRTVAQNVSLTWAGTLSLAQRWVQDNRDAAAVIVEADVRGESCAAFVEHVRGLGLAAPVVVVSRGPRGLSLADLKADDVVAHQSIQTDLPRIINRILQRTPAAVARETAGLATVEPRETAHAGLPSRHAERAADARAAARLIELEQDLAQKAARQTTLEQSLAAAEAARLDAAQRHAAELAAAAARLSEREVQHQAAMARAVRICRALEERGLELEAALRQAEQRRASESATSVDHLARRHAEFTASLTQAARSRDALAEQLSAARAALSEATQIRTAEAAAAAERLARREAELGAALTEAEAGRTALEQQLAQVEAALHQAEERARYDEHAAAEREAELQERLSRQVTAHNALEQALADVRGAFEQSRQKASEAAAEAMRDLAAAAARQTELEGRLASEAATRTSLEQNLKDADAARQDVAARHASELAAAAARLADLQTQHDTAVAQAAATRATFEQQLTDAQAALERAVEAGVAEAAAAAERLAQREAELGAALAESSAARTALEGSLAETTEALRHAQQRAESDLAAAAARQTELEGRLASEAVIRASLEQNLKDADAARQDVAARRASELAAAAARLADLQTQHDTAVAQAAATRATFEQQLTDAQAALERAVEAGVAEAAAAAERLAQREAELGAALAESSAARTALEGSLAETTEALHHAQQRAESDLAAAAARQTELGDRLAQEIAARTSLERELAETRMAAGRSRHRLLNVASELRRRSRQQQGRLEARLELERTDYDRALRTNTEDIRRLESERDTLQQSLATAQQQLRLLTDTLDDERQQHELDRTSYESARDRLSADLDQARQSLDQVRAGFDTLERVSSEHAAERARLEGVVAERDEELSAQAARQLASEQAASDALAQIQQSLDLTRETSRREIADRQRELDAQRQELEATRLHSARLQSEADRVPGLVKELEESNEDNRRQFERAPYGICRCTSDGAITHANGSLVRLLGYQTEDELREVDFATGVFDSESDLRWLLDRPAGTGQADWIETTWRRKDRRRLIVRLQLQARSDGSIDIIVDDVSRLRDAEERLRQAQRMEAVGRLASEVAATCDSLLRDASVNGQQWLAEFGDDTPLRLHGELVLDEVTRAASYLRQLTVYGNKQVSALEPVSVQRILRDLEPVLKRVAGDNIELVLPKASVSADVDVEAERVERVLVNVANYARERMPYGGRVKIDLGTTTVDRRFIAKHPGVRPGAHVLITVTEVRGPDRPILPPDLRAEPAAADASAPESVKPGVDLGALLGLIGECGGHLWMAAEPPGNMTLKIHLPKRAQDDAVEAGAVSADARAGGGPSLRGGRARAPRQSNQ